MPVLEANPEIAKQAQEAVTPIADQPEAHPHAETSSDMTSEQAIKVCPYLGSLAAQDPELAKQKAQEYISDPEKMAQMHPDQEANEDNPEDNDSFWDDLEAEFATEETVDDETEDEQFELSEAVASDPPEEDDSDSDPIAIAEPAIAQFDREDAIAQEEIQNRQFSDNNSDIRRKRTGSRENFDHVVDIDGIVRRVIAVNPQVCKAFKNGDAGALDILVREAIISSKASK